MLRSAMIVVAHPDDETMLAGGTLAMLSAQGVRLHVLCATRGEGGELGEPPLGVRGELGAIREGEMRCAARALGVYHVEFLGYVDPLVGPDDALFPFKADFNTLAGQMYNAVRASGVELVLTHGSDGEYGHPAHQLVHRAARAAVERLGERVLLYSVAANVPGIEDRLWNESETAHFALDIRPWLDAKERAALCHQSQHALFKRRRKLETVREALRTTEGFYRQHPEPRSPIPQDAFAAMLRTAGAWTPQA